MAAEQKQPVSSAWQTGANNIRERFNSQTCENATEKYNDEKLDQNLKNEDDERQNLDESDNEQQASDEDEKPSAKRIQCTPEYDSESLEEDIENFTLEEDSVEVEGSWESSEDEKDEDIESIAASLVENAIKGAVEKVTSEKPLREVLSDNGDVFNIDHRTVINVLIKIKNITAAFVENGGSASEAKEVVGCLWLVLLNFIEMQLNVHSLPIPVTRFFNLMEALHDFFQNTDENQANIDEGVVWRLHKEYFKQMPLFMMYAGHFGRTMKATFQSKNEKATESVAPSLDGDATKGAANTSTSDERLDRDMFDINHKLVFELLSKIKKVTASLVENGESVGEAKKVVGSLWLVLLNYIEVCLNAHSLPIPARRFYNIMSELNGFFNHLEENYPMIKQSVIWSLHKEYYKQLSHYFMHADQFNRIPRL